MPDLTPPALLRDGTPCPQALLTLPFETTRGQASLSDFLGHRLVLYFYPKDDTPGCTVEAKDFSELHANFLKSDTQVVGASRDSLRAHERFIQKYGLSLTLIADTHETLCQAFDVLKTKNMYGKTVRGVERSTFLFDANGLLLRQWRGVKSAGHAAAVYEATRELR